MSKDKKNTAEIMREKATEYLNKKYNDTFTAEGYTSSNWAYDYSSITFTPKSFPSSIVEVRAYKNADDSYTFKDNYFKCLMNNDAVDFFKDFLKDAEVKVRFPNTIWSDELGGASSFSEWQSIGNCKVDSYFITNNILSDDVMNSIVESIAKQKVSGTVTFITTADENKLRSEDLDNILNNQDKFISEKYEYYINSNFKPEK